MLGEPFSPWAQAFLCWRSLSLENIPGLFLPLSLDLQTEGRRADWLTALVLLDWTEQTQAKAAAWGFLPVFLLPPGPTKSNPGQWVCSEDPKSPSGGWTGIGSRLGVGGVGLWVSDLKPWFPTSSAVLRLALDLAAFLCPSQLVLQPGVGERAAGPVDPKSLSRGNQSGP